MKKQKVFALVLAIIVLIPLGLFAFAPGFAEQRIQKWMEQTEEAPCLVLPEKAMIHFWEGSNEHLFTNPEQTQEVLTLLKSGVGEYLMFPEESKILFSFRLISPMGEQRFQVRENSITAWGDEGKMTFSFDPTALAAAFQQESSPLWSLLDPAHMADITVGWLSAEDQAWTGFSQLPQEEWQDFSQALRDCFMEADFRSENPRTFQAFIQNQDAAGIVRIGRTSAGGLHVSVEEYFYPKDLGEYEVFRFGFFISGETNSFAQWMEE